MREASKHPFAFMHTPRTSCSLPFQAAKHARSSGIDKRISEFETQDRKMLSQIIIGLRAYALVILISGAVTLGSPFAFGQTTDLKGYVDARFDAIEKTIDRLFNIILLIPTLAAVVVVVLQVRSWVREKEESQLGKSREQREEESAKKVGAVMDSVQKLLSFQAEQAKRLDEASKIPIPRGRIDETLKQITELRAAITRHNFQEYSSRIIALCHRMDNLEELGVEDFKQSIGCHYIRGLAALLQSDIDADRHFRTVRDLIKAKPPPDHDRLTEPMSCYFCGIHLKNIAEFAEARKSFERAFEAWPKSENEVRTLLEIAEVVALETQYAPGEKRTKSAREAVDRVNRPGERERLNSEQKRNMQALEERLFLIEGNYAFKHEKWDRAIEQYERGRSSNPDGVFAGLSMGIALWKKGSIDDAKRELMESYLCLRKKTHAEARGRILLGVSAIIAAKLSGVGEPDWLFGQTLRDIDELLRKNPQKGHTFHIFSPLTKQMHTLRELPLQLENPERLL